MAKQEPKLGAGHAGAFARQGLAELRSALYSDSNVAQPSAELGIYGTKSPQEVVEAKREDSIERTEEARSPIDERLEQAERADVAREPEQPEPEKD